MFDQLPVTHVNVHYKPLHFISFIDYPYMQMNGHTRTKLQHGKFVLQLSLSTFINMILKIDGGENLLICITNKAIFRPYKTL